VECLLRDPCAVKLRGNWLAGRVDRNPDLPDLRNQYLHRVSEVLQQHGIDPAVLVHASKDQNSNGKRGGK